MKLSLDSTMKADRNGKRHSVPAEALQIGMQVLERLTARLQNTGSHHHMELIRIRFTPEEPVNGELRAVRMIVTFVTGIQLFDLLAVSRSEQEQEFMINLLAIGGFGNTPNVC